jgi:cytochrome c1
VTEYWTPRALRQFIRDPASIRANAKMPKPADLDDEMLRVLEEYLREMRNHKFMVQKRP